MPKKPNRRVVWNGQFQRPQVESDLDHAMVTHDLETISIREYTALMNCDGVEHIYIFGCEPGGSCLSTGHGGVFSLAIQEKFATWKTLRDLISEINKDIAAAGYEQRAEVACRADLLDIPIEELPKHSRDKVVMMQFDMCRPD